MGSNSSSGKQRRLLGELHTRMLSSGNMHSDRTSLRLFYLPTLRQTLTAPLALQEKEGIEPVIEQMHAYCIARDDLDYVLDVTKWKTKSSWGEDPMKGVPTQVKAAFTRYVHSVLPDTVSCKMPNASVRPSCQTAPRKSTRS